MHCAPRTKWYEDPSSGGVLTGKFSIGCCGSHFQMIPRTSLRRKENVTTKQRWASVSQTTDKEYTPKIGATEVLKIPTRTLAIQHSTSPEVQKPNDVYSGTNFGIIEPPIMTKRNARYRKARISNAECNDKSHLRKSCDVH